MATASPPPRHRARKRFGQHFLHDRTVIERILAALDPRPGQRLLEIGPGRGALTLPLLARCRRLVAVEIDRDLAPRLEALAAGHGELEIVNADILEFDLAALPGAAPWRLVGNLPYNISTPLMFHLFGAAGRIVDMHFMVQEEVARRLVAKPGDGGYGRLSVMVGYHCAAHYLFGVAPGSFSPPPRVDSAVVRLVMHSSPPVEVGDYAGFADIVRAAFGQRRKTLANALKAHFDRDAIAACGVDPGARAENLELDDFAALSRAASR